jgi:flagellar motor switch protein FliN
MSRLIASWLDRAAEILGQELGAPVDLLPGGAIPAEAASVTWTVDIAGDWEGTFTVSAERTAMVALFGATEPGAAAGADQWEPLFKRICIAAAALLEKESGRSCEVAMISHEDAPVSGGMGYQLRFGEQVMALVIADRVEIAVPSAVAGPSPSDTATVAGPPPAMGDSAGRPFAGGGAQAAQQADDAVARQGIELLLDIELEASLRFGSSEMALSDLLALGPGDVVQLDRALTDPVDLIIGDKIVARGEVVLVNGNFGLQVTEVAEPRKCLESIRCLF